MNKKVFDSLGLTLLNDLNSMNNPLVFKGQLSEEETQGQEKQKCEASKGGRGGEQHVLSASLGQELRGGGQGGRKGMLK